MRTKSVQEQKFLRSFILMLFLLGIGIMMQAQVSVSGTVTDRNKETMIGVTVAVKGTTIGAATNVDGKYSIQVPSTDAVLVFTYMGYKSREVKVGSQKTINVTMEDDTQLLDEVIVTGFQTQKKVNLTGAVASVNAEALENKPVANVGQALQGVVPNLNVKIDNGGLNTVPSFNVRGETSFYFDDKETDANKKWKVSSGSPLILVDGVETGGEQINLMNPNDIESISVIKDASASAIYGARASFGVMIITTKSGKYNQKAKVNYSFDMQWDSPQNNPDLLDSYTYQKSTYDRREWRGGSGMSDLEKTILEGMLKYQSNPSSENAWMYEPGSTSKMLWLANTNSFKEVVRDVVPMQKHNVSVSGGSETVKYNISLGYQNQDGFYKPVHDNIKRYNALVNLTAKISKQFEVSTKISYNASNHKEPFLNTQKGKLWAALLTQTPRNINMPIKTGPNDPIANTWTDNIVGWIAYGAKDNTKNSSAIYSLNPTYKAFSWLTLKGEFSYRKNDLERRRIIPVRNYIIDSWSSTSTAYTNPSTSQFRSLGSDLYTINIYTDFNKKLAKDHTISGIAGYNQEWSNQSEIYVTSRNLLTDNPVLGLSSGQPLADDISEEVKEWSIRGMFGRINYNYADRYLLEINGRYDGSSKFTKGDRFKFFPSFSAAWRISEESFMTGTRSWLDNLKLRGSWGAIGNQNVAEYAYFSKFSKVDGVGWLMNGSKPIGIKPPKLVSPDLTWETATTINGGLDMAVLKNRLDASLDIYQRKTSDILSAGAAYPGVLGAEAPLANSGIIITKGWELSLKWNDKLSNGLRYDVTFNIGDSHSEVTEFNDNASRLLSKSMYEGMKIGEIWGYETVGILQKEDFDDKGKLTGPDQSKINANWYPGDVRYKDLDGDGKVWSAVNTYDNPGDRRIIGNNTPRYKYGLSGNIYFKGFDVNIFFQGVGKRDYWITDGAFWGHGDSSGNRYMYENSWTPVRTNAKYPMYGVGGQNAQVQSGYLFDASYLRLKQVTLGYTLPTSLTSKMALSRVRLNASGYNLFTITDIPKVLDADLISSVYPVMQSFAIGVQVAF